MILRIESVEPVSGRFQGTLHWPALEGGTTTVEGRRQGDTLTWTEPSLIAGRRATRRTFGVVMNGGYAARYDGETISGNWYEPENGKDEGAFALRRST
jgi:hypothetical protein